MTLFADKCLAVVKLLGSTEEPGSLAARAALQCSEWAVPVAALVVVVPIAWAGLKYSRAAWPYIQKGLVRCRDAFLVLVGRRGLAPARKPLAIVPMDTKRFFVALVDDVLQVAFNAALTNNTAAKLFVVNVEIENMTVITSSFGVIDPTGFMGDKNPVMPGKTAEFHGTFMLKKPAGFRDDRADLALSFILTDNQGDRHPVRDIRFRQPQGMPAPKKDPR